MMGQMDGWRAAMLAAALIMPAQVVMAKTDILTAADLTKLERKVPVQPWYPEGYYDVRIAAEGEATAYPRALSDILFMMDGKKTYDTVDCGREYVVPDAADPVTTRYGDVAMEIAQLRSEFERMGFPLAVYDEPLRIYERALIDEARAKPLAEEADDNTAAPQNEEEYDYEKAPYSVFAKAVEANRQRLAPKLPVVIADGGCGDGGLDQQTIIRTVPPSGEVLLVNAFAFKVCTRKLKNPWDRFACRWNEVETGKATDLSGRYVYQVRWPDGTVKRGTREIYPEFEATEPNIVTIRKTGN